MALIICTECGKEFSDKAAACPNCGCPTEDIVSEREEKDFKESVYQEIADEINSSENREEDDVAIERIEIPIYDMQSQNDKLADSESKFDKQKEILENKKNDFISKKNEIVRKFDKVSKSSEGGEPAKKVKVTKMEVKKASPKTVKMILIIVIAVVLLLLCISGVRSIFKDRVSWNEIVLGELLPEPDSKKGQIWDNSTSRLEVDMYNTSSNDYYAYISKCSEEDFLIEPESDEFSYSAYNKDGYKLTVSYTDYSEEMSIELIEPIKLDTINWNFNGLGEQIPELESNKGRILDDGEESFSLYVGDIDRIEFEKYVERCSSEGFNIDSTTTDVSYEAKNSDRYRILVEYIGFDIIQITVYEPVYIVGINVSCIENLFMNEYDVDVSVNNGASLGIVKHGKQKTFQVELPKGTHTLNCENDISDEDYEDYDATGEIEFEVKGDMDIAFELYCRTDSIEVDIISEENDTQTDENGAQNADVEERKLGKNEVRMPESAFMYEGEKYQDVKAKLKKLGFKNIQTEAVYDLGTGWLGSSSIDDVKNISISGNSEFNEGDIFNKDDKIIITYRKYEIDDPSIEYKKYTVSKMMDDLDENAARANEKYSGEYVEITGRITLIDSTASSIDLVPSNNSWEIRTVTCIAKTEEQEEHILDLSNGDVITVKGKISIANEYGYVMSIYSFK